MADWKYKISIKHLLESEPTFSGTNVLVEELCRQLSKIAKQSETKYPDQSSELSSIVEELQELANETQRLKVEHAKNIINVPIEEYYSSELAEFVLDFNFIMDSIYDVGDSKLDAPADTPFHKTPKFMWIG